MAVDSRRWRFCGWLSLALLLCMSLAWGRADLPVIHSRHWQAAGQSMDYIAEVGRIPIREAGSDQILAHMAYVAYRRAGHIRPDRPLIFLWNGGPGANSALINFKGFGPSRWNGHQFEDNPQSLLPDADLVFVDAIGAGYSRPMTVAAGRGFYATKADMRVTAEFIRAWLQVHDRRQAPIYLLGESFGVWRAAGAAELLEQHGQAVKGIILISGGAAVGNLLPMASVDAMRIPGYNATRLFYTHGADHGDTCHDPQVVAAERWVLSTYLPALTKLDKLSAANRTQLIRQLASYSGLPTAAIDPRSLVIRPRQFRTQLPHPGPGPLNTFDMRSTLNPDDVPAEAVQRYYSESLGYITDLPYVGFEQDRDSGYYSDDNRAATSIGANWNYDSAPITPQAIALAQAGGGPPGAQPWALNALKLDPRLRVMVDAGLYDSLNSCFANRYLLQQLPARQARQFEMHCYASGHMIYLDRLARDALLKDIRAFVGS